MKRYVAMVRTDIDDRDLTESALMETGLTVPVQFVADTDELDALLLARGEPSLILLNDNDIRQSGFERLAQLKANPLYSHIPVILLGEISTDEYIRKCYQAGANSFIVKPSTVAETNQKIETFFNYWFKVAAI